MRLGESVQIIIGWRTVKHKGDRKKEYEGTKNAPF